MPNNANFLAPNSKALPPSFFSNMRGSTISKPAPKTKLRVQDLVPGSSQILPTGQLQGSSSHNLNGAKRLTKKY